MASRSLAASYWYARSVWSFRPSAGGDGIAGGQSLDESDLAAERQRAANAIDAMAAASGPFTEADIALLGHLAVWSKAHLAYALTTDPTQQQIPLLAGQGPSASYLTWTRATIAPEVFHRFAPVRLPIIGGMLLWCWVSWSSCAGGLPISSASAGWPIASHAAMW